LEILISVYFIYILIKVFVSFFQIFYIKKELKNKAIFLKKDDYIKAGNYAIEKEKLSVFESILDGVVFFVWVLFGLSILDIMIQVDDQIIKAICFVMTFILVGAFISIPYELYKTFVLDKKYGFTKDMTIGLFLSDTLKSFILTLVFGTLIVGIVAYIISLSQNWWIYSFIVLFSVIILVNILYPIIRGTMFDKFSELEDLELKEKIEKLLDKVGFESSGIFTVDASKRDNRLNAYFGGLGKTKRVVLFDTLIEKLTHNELIAVLGHELGHFKNGDIFKNIAIMGGLLFFTFFTIATLPIELYTQMSLEKEPATIIIMFLLISNIIFFIAMPIINLMSRHNEYEADKFGADIGSNQDLTSALLKLVNENLSFPKSHKFYIFFYYSHPPLIERLKELGYKEE
jgi:STE24 endopeptidase